MEDWKLCYVDDWTMYFTSLPLEKQWGDDWNDAPFEHNAGTPYESHGEFKPCAKVHYRDAIVPGTQLIPPSHGHINSQWSVQAINKGSSPWLRAQIYRTDPWEFVDVTGQALMAGASISEATDFVHRNGGIAWMAGKDNPQMAIVQELCAYGRVPTPYVDSVTESFNPNKCVHCRKSKG